MEVETGDFRDWEVLHNSDSDSVEDMKGLEGIEGDSEGIIRSDYFSLDSQSKYSRTIRDGDVIEEGSVESDNPSWIDPGSETRSPRKDLGEFWSDSGSDRSDDRKFGEIEGRNELGFVENAKGQVGSDGIEEIVVREFGNSETVKAQVGSEGIVAESENSGKLWYDSSGIEGLVENIEMGVGEKANLLDGVEVSSEKEDADQPMEGGDKRSEDGDVVIGAKASDGEGEKRIMFWWKLPLELLKYFVFRISPVWTVSMAAAAMGFVILGRRYYMMKRKSRSMQLKVTMDDKKVSQFMSRAARLNEAFSVVKRVPVIRPSLPAAGVTPWPVMTLSPLTADICSIRCSPCAHVFMMGKACFPTTFSFSLLASGSPSFNYRCQRLV